jgi:peroxiredoxin
VGVSPDDAERTAQACQELALTQTVLLDPGRKVAQLYLVTRLGGWLPNRRVTYRIGQDRRIEIALHSELGLDGHFRLLEDL